MEFEEYADDAPGDGRPQTSRPQDGGPHGAEFTDEEIDRLEALAAAEDADLIIGARDA